MVNRTYRLSSTKEGFAKECNKLRTMFSKLRYPKTLVDSTINKFSQEPDKEIHTVPSVDPSVYIVLPFKDQRTADRVRKDIYSLGAKIDVNVKRVFTSRKLSQTPRADLGGGCRGCAPRRLTPAMTWGFLIQLVFCKKKTIWFIGVELEQETSAPPPKKILDPPLNPECQGKQAPHRQHSMRCILISTWFVRCKLCRVHCPTLTSTHKWTPLFSHRETPWNTA